MFDKIGIAFFAALADAAAKVLAADHPCLAALQNAAKTGEPNDIAGADAMLRQLTDDERDRIMADAHRALRSDPFALFGSTTGPGEPTRH